MKYVLILFVVLEEKVVLKLLEQQDKTRGKQQNFINFKDILSFYLFTLSAHQNGPAGSQMVTLESIPGK